MEPIAIISIFALAVFVGFEVVSKVSSTLHTPLMSGANEFTALFWSVQLSLPITVKVHFS